MKIKGYEKYEYFHLAKWLGVPLIREKTEEDKKDYKIFRAGTYIDVRVTNVDFILRNKGHLIMRRTVKDDKPIVGKTQSLDFVRRISAHLDTLRPQRYTIPPQPLYTFPGGSLITDNEKRFGVQRNSQIRPSKNLFQRLVERQKENTQHLTEF